MREEAISYAIYRLISHRFESSPGVQDIQAAADNLMATLGYDISDVSTDTASGSVTCVEVGHPSEAWGVNEPHELRSVDQALNERMHNCP